MTSTFDDLITVIKSKEDPYTYIANFIPAIYWLDQLYIQCFKDNQVRPLKDLPQDKKELYWSKTNSRQAKWLRVLSCRAMIAYDYIK